MFETPTGLQIAYSLEPDQIGKTLLAFNGADLATVEELTPWLDLLATGTMPGHSTTMRSAVVPSEPMGSAPPLQALAYRPHTEADSAPRYATLAELDQAVPMRVNADNDAFAAQWGVLARLAGRTFQRHTLQNGPACTKVLASQDCLMLIRWVRPGEVLARYWFTDVGRTAFVDTIVPSAKPGVFLVYRWTAGAGEVGEAIIHATQDRLKEQGRETFASFPAPGTITAGAESTVAWLQAGYGGVLYASSRPTTDLLLQVARNLASIRQSNADAARKQQEQARDQRMRSIYNGLNAIGQAIDQQNQVNQQQFNQQLAQIQADAEAKAVRDRQDAAAKAEAGRQARAQAQAQALGQARAEAAQAQQAARPVQQAQAPTVRPVPTPPAPASPAARTPAARTSAAVMGNGGSALQPRTVQAYFAWGMALGPNNTRNPRCFSNLFSITYQSDPNGWGDAGRAAAEADPWASVFRQKCERLGRMDPGTPPAQIALPGVPFSYPNITAEDYRVMIP